MIVFELPGKREKLASLERAMSESTFWQDNDSAQEVIKEVKQLKVVIEPFDALETEAQETSDLLELASEEEDASLAQDLAAAVEKLDKEVSLFEVRAVLNDERDPKNAILTIHPGAGGTESCDWAAMLLRMYTRWLDTRGYTYRMVDKQDGDEAGIKSVTLTIEGDLAYGYLKSENGVHRLVRISPFDANKRRHTSFTAVEILPEVDDNIEIEIDEKDLRIDTFRASGAGGQHVNKTSSAVRMTHIPTGIVVQCQNERSQHKNRATAMKLLRARLYDRALKEKEAELAQERSGQADVAWGSQIRSYVLHPYQMIKDHRTGVETSNTHAVLDGDLDAFIEAYLRFDAQRKANR